MKSHGSLRVDELRPAQIRFLGFLRPWVAFTNDGMENYSKEKFMPIKEIVTFAVGAFVALVIANPFHFREVLRRTEIQILRDVGRTNNWGNPSIFRR